MKNPDSTSNYQDKARGMLLGLAIGDALGAPVEFLPEPSYTHIKAMGDEIEHFHENYRAPKAVWTDDTEMALCLADSLLANHGYDSYDIMTRFKSWSEAGYRTYDGKPACDVGAQTARAIDEFTNYPVVWKDTPKTESAGNGAIMRLAPIIIANTFSSLKSAIDMSVLSCRETHNSTAAEATTALFATALYYTLHGSSKTEILEQLSRQIESSSYHDFYLDNKDSLVTRALDEDEKQFQNLSGYIVDTFAISLWGLINYDNFKNGMLAVIRLGGDTDTNAACYGQLAGAYYGYQSIPEEWRTEVYLAGELVTISDDLLSLPSCHVLRTRFEDSPSFKEPE